ncbi:MAG: type II toxin-antitoxin system RelE/ParE family toxin [Planctomycetes bacterium]|nr:type II toxin-antitoxin system RelE/ParE family toxin [Planctomycetota bacterium]
MRYKVQIAPAANRQLKKFSRDAQKRLRVGIDSLADDPRPPGVKKLIGAEALWRIRIGDYRVVYEIQDAKLLVLVLRIAHRKDIYRKGK